MQSFTGHQHPVTSCAFSTDGEWILSASADSTLKLWNLTGKQLMTIYHFGEHWLSHDHSNHYLRFSERAWRCINWSNGVDTLPIETWEHEVIPNVIE